jgi:hypothetical protein
VLQFWNNKGKKMLLNFLQIKYQKKSIRENMAFHLAWQEFWVWAEDIDHKPQIKVLKESELLQWELSQFNFQEIQISQNLKLKEQET